MRRLQSLSSLSCISLQLEYVSQPVVQWIPIALPDFLYGLNPVYFHNCLRKLSAEIQLTVFTLLLFVFFLFFVVVEYNSAVIQFAL